MSDQVIVVGGGLAGHAAAHTVLEAGGAVLLLDKSPFCGGNSTKATSGINGAGTRAQRAAKIDDSAEIFEQDTLKSAAAGARPELIRALTHQSGPAVEWLRDAFGLKLDLVGQMGAHSRPRTHRGGERFPGMMITYALMERFEATCKALPHRAKLVNKATVTSLLTNQAGETIGCEYKLDGKIYKAHGAVILATGGFAADFGNASLLAASIPNLPKLNDMPTTNGPHCTGDGIKLAQALGAELADMEFVQVHPTGLVDPREPDAKVKWLAAEALRGSGGLLLDARGQRFCNELGKRDYVSGRMFQNAGPFRLVLNSRQAAEFEWHCHHYVGRGVMRKFASGHELARDMGVSIDTLRATFDAYNAAASKQADPFGKTIFNNVPFRVDDVYHVAQVTPVVHYTMGGLACNDQGQVLGKAGQALPGLFAAGEVIGGIHGHNRLGGSSLLDCVVYGRLAGSAAARFLLERAVTQAGQGQGGTTSGKNLVEIDWQHRTITLHAGNATGVGAAMGADEAPAETSTPGPEAPPAPPKELKTYTMEEVAKHNTKGDCWVVVHDKVYDLTTFLEDHPGGAASIVAYAGKEATKAFDMLHSADILDKVRP
ncbi:uncharacterized protein MONBRDRAFT_18701 [Monosiga brevicollis MX1]|uniref:fumarate reductase (NADH) n=1 Tax=Monosiga brevicollis TaxID=81824 RepID=A9UX24_MONBE|nr:uncharacterized protein MONBRDRAFT_18701 [Monosiga brevicollis MX1]EDQ90140.1 predicted protein [Monosiga brevicollis MX1]|eukprot:XP_001744907.1 hypothetical protein [Monosiga brevicollis MX1]